MDIDAKRDLWELAMHDLLCDHYESNNRDNKTQTHNSPTTHATTSNERLSKRTRTGVPASAPPRRSTRLCPATPKEHYIHHYNLLLSRNESALLELAERAHSSIKRLSFSVRKRLLKEYEPVAVNRRVRMGGKFSWWRSSAQGTSASRSS